ncbi:MAG: hypothetical protein DBY36_01885 [Clostridiales bacterium]|nr:MAG: hypothetical protein DBY36_01885 [Clostridiales bacterium]
MLVERKDYTHLLYVRKYSISTNDYELYVYGVNTTDIYHTMGEMYFRSIAHIERIDFAELTPDNAQAKLDFWKSEGKEILVWHDKYKTDAVPVVNGVWLPVDEKNDAFDCSACDSMVSKKLNYCPVCGAKMTNTEV